MRVYAHMSGLFKASREFSLGFSDEPRTNKTIGAMGADGTERLQDSPDHLPSASEQRGNIPFVRELEQEPTMREIEVLQLISDGLVNREIGVRLFLSEETVKSHVRHLLAKLQARSRAHAVAVGFRRGLIA